MKKLWFGISMISIVLLFTSCATSGPILTPDQMRVVEIIDCPGIDKDRLFILANSWAVDTFVSAESVIEFSDKEAGIIKGKYVMSFSIFLFEYNVRSTLTIEIKDGAARLTIADPYLRVYAEGWTPYRPYETAAEGFNKHCMPKYLDLIASFENAVQEPENAF